MSPQRADALYAPFYKIIVQSLIHRDVTAIPNRECDGPLYTVYKPRWSAEYVTGFNSSSRSCFKKCLKL